MGNRRFAQVSTSDEEDEAPLPPRRSTRSNLSSNDREQGTTRKKIKLQDDDEDYEIEESNRDKKDSGSASVREEIEKQEEEEEDAQEDAKPIGAVVRVSGKGRGRKNHYQAFEFDGSRYEIEDSVLLVPEDKQQKPYVAIIKDITQSKNGSLKVDGQWFYRPEEAEKNGGGTWKSGDTRELFYSFHRDDVPAESVMHKCVVHFVPLHKQIPKRKLHPGFIVQKVYDTVEQKLWHLTDKDYEDSKQHEIDLLVQKTLMRLGDLPDIETGDSGIDEEDQVKTKRTLRKRNISPVDVTRSEEATTRTDQHLKAETPGSCTGNASEHYMILSKFNALTGETHRDKWLEKLLQGAQYICSSPDSLELDGKEKGSSNGMERERDNKSPETANPSQEKNLNSGKHFIWPDAAVSAVTALEKVSHDALSSDFQKYNQKLRQLVFNLKNNAVLAQRLLNRELEPSKILNMSPNELKEGLTAEEIAAKQPDQLESMEMTGARCTRCNEFKVGLRDIIQAGHGDRYQLECIACGNSWYASRDEASVLTTERPSSVASAKPENSGKDFLAQKKDSEAHLPLLETQKSLGLSGNEDKS